MDAEAAAASAKITARFNHVAMDTENGLFSSKKTGRRNSRHVILPNKTCSEIADSGAVLGHELARWSVNSDRRYRRAGGAFDL